MSDRKGFTLVELLVVIGIIALLISILLPSLARARDAANAVACASNMRQIGMGIMFYVDGNKGYLPAADGTGSYYTRWPIMLVNGGYLQGAGNTPTNGNADKYNVFDSTKLWACPSDPTANVGQTIGASGNNQGTISYIPNNLVLVRSDHWGGPYKITQYENASGRLMLAESDWTHGYWSAASMYPADWSYRRLIQRVVGRHGGERQLSAEASAAGAAVASKAQSNVLFMDGHVEMMPIEEIWRPALLALAADPDPDPRGLWGTERPDRD